MVYDDLREYLSVFRAFAYRSRTMNAPLTTYALEPSIGCLWFLRFLLYVVQSTHALLAHRGAMFASISRGRPCAWSAVLCDRGCALCLRFYCILTVHRILSASRCVPL